MKADLFASDAPMTVNNFVFLAGQGYYDGVTFHRVIVTSWCRPVTRRGRVPVDPAYRFNDEPVSRQI